MSYTAVAFEDGHRCVACGSQEVNFVREIESRRTGSVLNLYFCGECESFAMPSSYDQGSTPAKSLEFHKRVLDRNLKWSRNLFQTVRRAALPRQTVVEIGCGSGATLHVARQFGAERVLGYDPNSLLVDYGANRLGVEIRDELWNRNADHPRADILLCISVIEHLSDPQPLVGEFAAYCAEHGSVLIASVPLHGPDRYRDVFTPHRKGSPFRAGDSHVMYYSEKGFSSLFHRAGARHMLLVPVRGWHMYFVVFDDETARQLRRARRRLPEARTPASTRKRPASVPQ